MAKESRPVGETNNDNSVAEIGDLRDMMQNLGFLGKGKEVLAHGKDLRSWLFKIDQFFFMENVGHDEKVIVVALQLKGEAIQWHLPFM
ncbi:hypothetical protein KY284_029765 [Solanum tuberosum]|nr:hypothetical protein KY284_029765 [Solanum tuberosum]